MTCIVGLIDDGHVYIGGDSAGVAGLDIYRRKDEKVFKIRNEFIMGFTTSFRMGQLLRYSFEPTKIHQDTGIFEYMVTEFVEEVRKSFKRGGFLEKDKETESGGTFLVGFKGRLFRIEGDFQVGEVHHSFEACGCGQGFALGAMFSNGHIKDPEKRIINALEAAQEFSAGVREPFIVEKL